MIKKLKNLYHGITLAYGVRFGIEMALYEALNDHESNDMISTAARLYKRAIELCPKFIVNLIVRHDVGKP